MKTKSQIRTMITSHLDNDVAEDATVNLWIDEANQWLWNRIEDAEFKRKRITFSTVVDQQEYTLPPCVAKIIKLWNASGEIPIMTEREYIASINEITDDDDVEWNTTGFRILEPDRVGKYYSTGTVSGTIATKDLIGIGTAWNTGTNCELGDIIVIASKYYNVEAITDDTNIVLAQKLDATASGATYTLEGINRMTIKFNAKPKTVQTINVLCTTPAYPLVSDDDYPRVPSDFHDLIALKGILIGHEYDEDIRNFGMVQALFKEEEDKFYEYFKNRLSKAEKFNSLFDSDTFDHTEHT